MIRVQQNFFPTIPSAREIRNQCVGNSAGHFGNAIFRVVVVPVRAFNQVSVKGIEKLCDLLFVNSYVRDIEKGFHFETGFADGNYSHCEQPTPPESQATSDDLQSTSPESQSANHQRRLTSAHSNIINAPPAPSQVSVLVDCECIDTHHELLPIDSSTTFSRFIVKISKVIDSVKTKMVQEVVQKATERGLRFASSDESLRQVEELLSEQIKYFIHGVASYSPPTDNPYVRGMNNGISNGIKNNQENIEKITAFIRRFMIENIKNDISRFVIAAGTGAVAGAATTAAAVAIAPIVSPCLTAATFYSFFSKIIEVRGIEHGSRVSGGTIAGAAGAAGAVIGIATTTPAIIIGSVVGVGLGLCSSIAAVRNSVPILGFFYKAAQSGMQKIIELTGFHETAHVEDATTSR